VPAPDWSEDSVKPRVAASVRLTLGSSSEPRPGLWGSSGHPPSTRVPRGFVGTRSRTAKT